MTILLILLKIIGILLLAILLFVALLLFHPIFYGIKGRSQEEVSAEGYFWWFFQILRLEFQISNNEAEVYLRIFGFRKKIGGDTKETEKEPEPKETVKEEKKEKAREEPERAAQDTVQADDEVLQKKVKPRQEKTRRKAEPDAGRKRSFSIKEELMDQRNHKAVLHIWKEFLYLLAHLKPKEVKGEVTFGTGDPAMTGQITGAFSLLPIFYRYDAHIYPDFLSDGWYVRGFLCMKGHMALFHLLCIAVRLFKDRNIKRVYHKIRK